MLFGSPHFGYLEPLGHVSLALHRHGHLEQLLSRQILGYMYQAHMYNQMPPQAELSLLAGLMSVSTLFGSLHFGYLEPLGHVSLALHRHGHLKKHLSRQILGYMYQAHMYNHLHSSTVVEAITKALLPSDLLF
jgi:hypothetical protein